MTGERREWPQIVDAGASLAAYLDVDDVLRRVLEYAAESAGAAASAVLLHDAEKGELVVAGAGGPAGGACRGRRYPETSGVAGAVLLSGRPLAVPSAGRPLGRPHEIDGIPSGAVESVLAAPLRIGERTLGVVQAVNKLGGGEFGAADVERFAGVSSLIAVALESASLYRRLDTQSEILKRSREDHARPLVAESPAMQRALDQADRAAAGRSTVLLFGETGTGKEQVARRIHDVSPRAASPFVALNCGALPEGLLESELFGHEKGAFTGADRRRIGRFELADGGTLFLDEIGELPAGAQVKLLRVLQEHEITRVGGGEPIRVDVRLVAATHRDLPAEVRAGRFRDDLFFRIHVVPVRLPPLRDRPEDVEPLSRLFLDRLARELGRGAREITQQALERLRRHSWPGNVRELQNLIERLLVLGDEGPVTLEDVAELLPDTPAGPAGDLSLWEQERTLLLQALDRAGQNQTQAARLLKISREQLRTRMKRYGLLAGKA
jgi:transcriptional regulator with GAF, ATPase, and Fis domain